MMYGYGFDGDWGGHTLFGGFFMIVAWIAIVLFVLWIVRELSDKKRTGGNVEGGRTALDYLRERYAKGEIDRKEFEEKKKDLLQ